MIEVDKRNDVTFPNELVEHIGRHPVAAGVVSFSVGVVTFVSGRLRAALPTFLPVFFVVVLLLLVYLALALALFVAGSNIWYVHRDPRAPRAPRMGQATLGRLPHEPPNSVPGIAYNCVICGRPLTNAASMRARVGSTCIKTYGPRYLMVANPAHEQWAVLKVAAEVQRASAQAAFNTQHQRDLITFRQITQAWQRELVSPNAKIRQLRRGLGRRLLLTGALSFHLVFVGVMFTAVCFG
jgi:hypothetical protein